MGTPSGMSDTCLGVSEAYQCPTVLDTDAMASLTCTCFIVPKQLKKQQCIISNFKKHIINQEC